MTKSITISNELFSMMEICIEWIKRKIEGGEPFSVILISSHPDGQRATKYMMDSVEEGFQKFKEEINSYLKDLTAYSFSYDASIFPSGREQRVIICRVEETGMNCGYQFVQMYDFENPAIGFGSPIKLKGEIQFYDKVDSILK